MPRLLDVAAPIVVPEIDRFGAALARGFTRRREQQEARAHQERQARMQALQVDAAQIRSQREAEARAEREAAEREFKAKQFLAEQIGRSGRGQQGLKLPSVGSVPVTRTVTDPYTGEVSTTPIAAGDIAARRVAIATATQRQLAEAQKSMAQQGGDSIAAQQARILGLDPQLVAAMDQAAGVGAPAPTAAPAPVAPAPAPVAPPVDPAAPIDPTTPEPRPAPAPAARFSAEESAQQAKLDAEPVFNIPSPLDVGYAPLPFDIPGTGKTESDRRQKMVNIASKAATAILGEERARKVVGRRGDPLDNITWKVAEKFVAHQWGGGDIDSALSGPQGDARGADVFLSKRYGMENITLPDGRVIGQVGDPSPEAREAFAQTLRANGANSQDASRIARNIQMDTPKLQQDALQYLVKSFLPKGATMNTTSDAEYTQALKDAQKAMAAVTGDREQLVTAKDAALEIRQMLVDMARRGATPEEEELLDARRADILRRLATDWKVPRPLLAEYIEQTFPD